MTVIKVRDGTPKTATSLCVTCRNATIVKGTNLQQLVRCSDLERLINFPVADCTGYENKAHPRMYQLEEIAWIVQSRARGPAGFQGDRTEIEIVPPKKDE